MLIVKLFLQKPDHLVPRWNEKELVILAEYRRICEEFSMEEALEILQFQLNNYYPKMFNNTGQTKSYEAKNYAGKVMSLMKVAMILSIDSDKIIERKWLSKQVHKCWLE